MNSHRDISESAICMNRFTGLLSAHVCVLYIFKLILDGVDTNEWISVKMVDLYSELSVLCNAVSEFCTTYSCPVMRAGRYYEYGWADPSCAELSAPVFVSAPKYMELLMTWVDANLTQEGSDNSRTNTGAFTINAKIFCRRLFRVYAHLFCEHPEEIETIDLHIKYSLAHFLIFMREFGLLVSETEIEPIRSIIRDLGIPSLDFAPH